MHAGSNMGRTTQVAGMQASAAVPRRVKRFAWVMTVVIGVVTLTSMTARSDSGNSTTSSTKLVNITSPASASLDLAPLFIAVEKGFFRQHGLGVKINIVSSGIDAANQLASGQAQLGVLGSEPLLTAIAKGLPLRIIGINHGDSAYKNYNSRNVALVANANVAAPADLAGKTIGYGAGTQSEAFIRSFLKENGIAASSVKLVNVAAPDAVTALKSHAVDAFAYWEPFPTLALRRVEGSKIIQRGTNGIFSLGLVVANASYASSNPDVATNYLAAQAEAAQWARKNPGAAAEIAVHWVPNLDLDVAKAAIQHDQFGGMLTDGVRDGLAAKDIPFLQSINALPATTDANALVKTAIDPRYFQKVYQKYPQYFADIEGGDPTPMLK